MTTSNLCDVADRREDRRKGTRNTLCFTTEDQRTPHLEGSETVDGLLSLSQVAKKRVQVNEFRVSIVQTPRMLGVFCFKKGLQLFVSTGFWRRL
jgi:hypothetical protein